jgi:hypothetical protein
LKLKIFGTDFGILLRAGVDDRSARDRVRPRHHLGRGIDDERRMRRPLDEAMAVNGLVRADVQVGRAGVGVPTRGRAVEAGRLARADHADLVTVGRLTGVGRLLRPLAADDVVGGAGEQVHGEDVEHLRRAALEEQHVVGVAAA